MDLNTAWAEVPSARIVIDSAGIYFDACFILLLLGVASICQLHVLLAIVKVISAKAALQLLPFYRSDGYWIVLDYLGGRVSERALAVVQGAAKRITWLLLLTGAGGLVIHFCRNW